MENLVLNFGGFYNNIHDDNTDNMIENYFVEDDEIRYHLVNFKKLHTLYSRSYINFINFHLETNFIFKALNSPKEYNFKTDTILFDANKKDLLKVLKFIRENDLKDNVIQIIKDCTISKDGYIPFYTYSDFFKKENLCFLFESCLDAIISFLDDEFMQFYDNKSIYELIYIDGVIEKS